MARELVKLERGMNLLVRVTPKDPVTRRLVDRLVPGRVETIPCRRLLRDTVDERPIGEVPGKLPADIQRAIRGRWIDANDYLIHRIHERLDALPERLLGILHDET